MIKDAIANWGAGGGSTKTDSYSRSKILYTREISVENNGCIDGVSSHAKNALGLLKQTSIIIHCWSWQAERFRDHLSDMRHFPRSSLLGDFSLMWVYAKNVRPVSRQSHATASTAIPSSGRTHFLAHFATEF